MSELLLSRSGGLVLLKGLNTAELAKRKVPVRGRHGTYYAFRHVRVGPKVAPEAPREGNMPVLGLNAGINFRANMQFLEKEINGADAPDLADLKERAKGIEDGIAKRESEIPMGERKHEFELYVSEHRKILAGLKSRIHGIEHPEQTRKLCENLRPVHSLSVEKFARVLRGGGLKSLEQLGESGKSVAYARIEGVIRPKYGDKAAEIATTFLKGIEKGLQLAVSYREFERAGVPASKSGLAVREIDFLENDLKQAQSGAIAYDVDKKLGTNRHVFAVMGPNGDGNGYGAISIIMKRAVMEHPDFNMTPAAGTSFYSGEMYEHRRWATRPAVEGMRSERQIRDDMRALNTKLSVNREISQEDYEQQLGKLQAEFKELAKARNGKDSHFNRSKLNAKENPDYARYMARDITAQDGVDQYFNRNLHGRWEAHLPSYVPEEMFQEVVMTDDDLGKLRDKVASEFKGQDLDLFRQHLEKAHGFRVEVVGSDEEILPYMRKGFEDGKWADDMRKSVPYASGMMDEAAAPEAGRRRRINRRRQNMLAADEGGKRTWRQPLRKAFVAAPRGKDGRVDFKRVPQGATIWITKDGRHIPLTRSGDRFYVDFKAAKDAGYSHRGADPAIAHSSFAIGDDGRPERKKEKGPERELTPKQQEKREAKMKLREEKKAARQGLAREQRQSRKAILGMVSNAEKDRQDAERIRQQVMDRLGGAKLSAAQKGLVADTIVREAARIKEQGRLSDARAIANHEEVGERRRELSIAEVSGKMTDLEIENAVKDGLLSGEGEKIGINAGLDARTKARLEKKRGELRQAVAAYRESTARREAFERETTGKRDEDVAEILRIGAERLKVTDEDLKAAEKMLARTREKPTESLYSLIGKQWDENVGRSIRQVADTTASRQIAGIMAGFLGEEVTFPKMVKALGIEAASKLVAAHLRSDMNPARFDSFVRKVEENFAAHKDEVEGRAIAGVKKLKRELSGMRAKTTRGTIYTEQSDKMEVDNLVEQRKVLGVAWGQLNGTAEFIKALKSSTKADRIEVELSADPAEAEAQYRSFTFAKDRESTELRKSSFGNKLIVTPASLKEFYVKESKLETDTVKEMNRIKNSREGVKKNAAGREYVDYRVRGIKGSIQWRPQQRNDIEFLRKNGGSGIIARDTGGGKTLTAVGFHAKNLERDPSYSTLFAAQDRGGVEQQATEIRRHTNLPVVAIPEGASDYAVRKIVAGNKSKGTIWVVSHSDLAHNYKELAKKNFKNLTIDEPHKVFFNAKGEMTARARDIANRIKTEHRVGLTATPIQDNPADVFNLLHWVDPDGVGTKRNFRAMFGDKERFEVGGESKESVLSVADMNPDKQGFIGEMLKSKIGKYMAYDTDLKRSFTTRHESERLKLTPEMNAELHRTLRRKTSEMKRFIGETKQWFKDQYPGSWEEKRRERFVNETVMGQIKAMNELGGERNPKQQALARNVMRRPNEKHVVYVDDANHAFQARTALAAAGLPEEKIFSMIGDKRVAGRVAERWKQAKGGGVVFISRGQVAGHNLQDAGTLHRLGTVLNGIDDRQVDGRVEREPRRGNPTIIDYGYGSPYEEDIQRRIGKYKRDTETMKLTMRKWNEE